MSKVYENLDSSAISSVTIEDNVVKVVYTSNKDKEYTFDCQNTEEFQQELCEILTELELGHTRYSIGRFMSESIRNGKLTKPVEESTAE